MYAGATSELRTPAIEHVKKRRTFKFKRWQIYLLHLRKHETKNE